MYIHYLPESIPKCWRLIFCRCPTYNLPAGCVLKTQPGECCGVPDCTGTGSGTGNFFWTIIFVAWVVFSCKVIWNEFFKKANFRQVYNIFRNKFHVYIKWQHLLDSFYHITISSEEIFSYHSTYTMCFSGWPWRKMLLMSSNITDVLF